MAMLRRCLPRVENIAHGALRSIPVPVSSELRARWISSDPPPRKKRVLNVLAPFAKPAPTTPLAQVISPDAQDGSSSSKDAGPDAIPGKDDLFETTSTTPAATSFQDVPPPSQDGGGIGQGVKVVNTLPAMKAPSETEARGASGRRNKEIVVQGVTVPPRPIPPGEEECCMSGCINCVYTIYADELEEYTESVAAARTALLSARVPKADWPEDIRGGDADGAEEKRAGDKVVQHVDPTMSAFLALENKLKKKQAPESSAAA